jgi:hypothetical protein
VLWLKTMAVDFYGPAVATAGVGKGYRNVTHRVSWRDDQGFPHTAEIHILPPTGPAAISPTWHA